MSSTLFVAPLPMDGKGFTPDIALPIPQGWMVLIKPYSTPKKIGSLHVPESRVADEDLATPIGQVVALGPDCYRRADMFPSGPRCKVGDYVMFASYVGNKFRVGGGDETAQYRLIADDDVKALVPDPSIIRRDL